MFIIDTCLNTSGCWVSLKIGRRKAPRMCRVMASAFFGSHHWIPAFAGMTAKLTCGVRHPLLPSFPRRRESIAFAAATHSVPKVAHAGEDHGDEIGRASCRERE